MAVQPYNAQDDQEDPYKRAGVGSDSNAVDPNTPSAAQKAPTTTPSTAPGAAPADPSVKNFAQLQASGQAAPPAPVSQPAVQSLLTGSSESPPMPSVSDGTPLPQLSTAGFQPAVQTMGGSNGPSSAGPIIPPGTMGSGDPVQAQLAVQTATAPSTSATPSAANVTASPSSTDSLLPLLTGGAQGTNQTPLQQATTAATLNELKNPNPYNSDAVKSEYANLAGGIDADYDARQRGVTDQFARQGLSGSAGKDFASGRAADTEVGRRTAKEQLATNLADAQAKSQGEYQGQAINQGQAGSQQGVNNSLAYTRSLMDYGQNAFGNDLASSQFQEQQNNDQQQQLLQLLAAGYGA